MQRVQTSQLERGMVLAEGVSGADGQLILSRGTVLTRRSIELLRSQGVEWVFVREQFGAGRRKEGKGPSDAEVIEKLADRFCLSKGDERFEEFIRTLAEVAGPGGKGADTDQ